MELANPMIRKLSKVEEVGEDNDVCTYKSITNKTMFLLLMTIVGVMAFFALNAFGEHSGFEQMVNSVNLLGLLPALVCVIVAIITPILAWIFKWAAGVLGTLYSISEGYLIAMITAFYGGEYTGAVIMAVAITIVIVAVMAILYTKRIVTVDRKFKTIITTFFITSIISTILVVISALVFPNNILIQFITSNHGTISIVLAFIGVIIASLFLLSDFNTIEECVEEKRSKKYEWYAAFGLSFTVIWLYMKVLSLIIRLKGRD